MYPVKTATAVTSKPAYTEGGVPGFFTAGNPVAGIPATVPGEHWFNMTQEELLNVIRAAGLTPSAMDDTQLRQAVARLLAAAVAAHNESGTAHADIRALLAGIEIPNATETVAGIIRLATQAQVLAGSGGGAVTPETLAARLTAALAPKAPLASPALTGTPTAPTAPVTTNSTQLATTAFIWALFGTRSMTSPGYYKFPGGLILQWGTIGTYAGSGYALTFPYAFPTAAIYATWIDGGSNCGAPGVNLTLTGATFYMKQGSSYQSGGAAAWFALGY